jgi:hypothetical protein
MSMSTSHACYENIYKTLRQPSASQISSKHGDILFNSRPQVCSLPVGPFHQPCFVLGIFKIESHELFTQNWLQIAILLISAS